MQHHFKIINPSYKKSTRTTFTLILFFLLFVIPLFVFPFDLKLLLNFDINSIISFIIDCLIFYYVLIVDEKFYTTYNQIGELIIDLENKTINIRSKNLNSTIHSHEIKNIELKIGIESMTKYFENHISYLVKINSDVLKFPILINVTNNSFSENIIDKKGIMLTELIDKLQIKSSKNSKLKESNSLK